MELDKIEFIVDIIKIYIITILTYYINLKLINSKIDITVKEVICMFIYMFFVAIMSKAIKEVFGFLYGVVFMEILISAYISKVAKSDIIHSMIITAISLSINYIFLFISIFLSFLLNIFVKIQNEYINMYIIILIYVLFIYWFSKIRRVNSGIAFLEKRIENQYLEIFILNISVIILFCITILSNYNVITSNIFGIYIIIIFIIMFITIQKSLQLYYKQRLLVQDLEETKKELEDKKKEIKQLEQENLNFSKTSHSIAHKQKALEYKLNELALKNEIAEEIDVKNRLSNITKQISEEPEIEIPKTNISEIDDMLNYMKSECIKNKIKFEVQLNGNIYQMINNHITKEELEILIADHVKNAIIAVKCSNNSNRSILVRIGKIDGQYSIYIYDSGIEFEINTLHKLGKIPSTTHKESGGTGMGFMNTFDTLKKHKASITINEYGKPAKDNYTKVIMIVFNKKDEFNIISYRQKEIEVRKDEVNV